jgi:hypothetical protein
VVFDSLDLGVRAQTISFEPNNREAVWGLTDLHLIYWDFTAMLSYLNDDGQFGLAVQNRIRCPKVRGTESVPPITSISTTLQSWCGSRYIGNAFIRIPLSCSPKTLIVSVLVKIELTKCLSWLHLGITVSSLFQSVLLSHFISPKLVGFNYTSPVSLSHARLVVESDESYEPICPANHPR